MLWLSIWVILPFPIFYLLDAILWGFTQPLDRSSELDTTKKYGKLVGVVSQVVLAIAQMLVDYVPGDKAGIFCWLIFGILF